MQPYNQQPPNYYPPYGAPPPPRRRSVLPWILVGALATLGLIVAGGFVAIRLLGSLNDFPPFPDDAPALALSYSDKAAIEKQFASPGVYIVSDIKLYKTSLAQVNSMQRDYDRNLINKGWRRTESGGRYYKGIWETVVRTVSADNANQFAYLPSNLISNLGRSDGILLVVTLQNVD
jgi:hypothetical protein